MENIDLKISNMQKHIQKPAEMEARFSAEEKTKLAKASRDFESMLTSMMLKSMTKTTGGLLGEEGYGNDVFDTFFENEIASEITNTKGLGIAESIYKKMTGEELPMKEFLIKYRPTINDMVKPENGSQTNAVQPSTSAVERLKKYEPIIQEASTKHGVPVNLIKSIILTESAAKANAVSKADAKGLMQLMDATAKDMGVKNSMNPAQNINGGTKYIAQMLKEFEGDLEKSLAAYNAGPANVQKYNGIPPFNETQNYVTRVMGYLKHLEE
ncbi:MAG: murein transglycosylase [Ignavibacteria bacterium GWB2_35_6b]|nr:MAG: murein transglycosylase [Ignavibacteria bacterium GWB2_35_6b]